eukprot:gnl/Carplike_NY0171/1254_a1696_1095.p1 GENE.gnl/Carplike_NY0171/1254_a1696_1095~~gnl/Carplike_NY0171/1254_a1696_1095.p1  ORF type:complete len:312 (+),score=64.73 gnl/Carplike_NY0171/1254_a1696_1095:22-936(+)
MINTTVLAKALTGLFAENQQIQAQRSGKGKSIVSDDKNSVYAVVSLKRIPQFIRMKPYIIKLPKPFSPVEESKVCFICRDKDFDKLNALPKDKIAPISGFVSVSTIRDKTQKFQARRTLRDKYDVFLCDDSIVPMLPKLLGKTFFDSKKFPIPVKLPAKVSAGYLRAQADRVIKGEYFRPNHGDTHSLKVGTADMAVDQIVENVQSAVNGIVQAFMNVEDKKKLLHGLPDSEEQAQRKMKKAWQSLVRVVSVKLSRSKAIPVFYSSIKADDKLIKLAGPQKIEPKIKKQKMDLAHKLAMAVKGK